MATRTMVLDSVENGCWELDLFPTELGWMGLAATAQGVVRLVFDVADAATARDQLQAAAARAAPNHAAARAHIQRRPTRRTAPPKVDRAPSGTFVAAEPSNLLAWARRQLQLYAAGRPVDLAEIPIDLSGLTDFQREVSRACQRIPLGTTRSYAQLAADVGRPGAARAAGSVMSRNPLPLLIPCHRVVGAGGRLGGFSSRGGLATKELLLRREAAVQS